jgi:hypothetical protein
VPAASPPAGTFGASQFRTGALPIVVEITDAHWHDPSAGVAYADLLAAFKGSHAKFMALNASYGGTSIQAQPNTLSDDTGTNVPPSVFGGACGVGKCCTGVDGAAQDPTGPGGTCRLNFQYGTSGISDSVIAGLKAIAEGATFDVYPVIANDPGNAGGVDATQFIQSVVAENGDAALGCPVPAVAPVDSNGDGVVDTFPTVTSDVPVCFTVIPKENVTVKPADAPQFFRAKVSLKSKALNDQVLDTRDVFFYVPPSKLGGDVR